MAEDLKKARRERADRLSLHTRKVPKRKEVMTLLLSLVVLALLLLTECSSPTSATALAQQPLIKFIRTVQVTPDDQFLTGSFARINYVPATNRFVVSFGTKASTVPNVTLGAGYAYKEYNLDMQEIGRSGILEWYPDASEAGDSG